MGLCITTHANHGRNARRPSGIIKLRATSSAKPKIQLRSLNKRFWYTAPDGTTRLATTSDPSIIPTQTNTYHFNPSHFSGERFPSSLPRDATWPTQSMEDVIRATGKKDPGCVGDRCYTNNICKDKSCDHRLEDWIKATADWEKHVELRLTDGRGIGVFAKRKFRRGDVLGWYSGELKPLKHCGYGDYLMEMDIGTWPPDRESESDADSESDCDEEEEEEEEEENVCPKVFIDAQKKGNWTRFINHSCKPHAYFMMRRVGGVNIMTVEAGCDVAAGKELTVSYGSQYYGPDTDKVCCCGSSNCVGRKRQRQDKARREQGGRMAKVKKCRRVKPF